MGLKLCRQRVSPKPWEANRARLLYTAPMRTNVRDSSLCRCSSGDALKFVVKGKRWQAAQTTSATCLGEPSE